MGWWNKLIRNKKTKEMLSEKEEATQNGKPYVRVIEVKLQENQPSQGYFELDWNQHFVQSLRDSGYYGASDEEIVDQWFTSLCRNISEQI